MSTVTKAVHDCDRCGTTEEVETRLPFSSTYFPDRDVDLCKTCKQEMRDLLSVWLKVDPEGNDPRVLMGQQWALQQIVLKASELIGVVPPSMEEEHMLSLDATGAEERP